MGVSADVNPDLAALFSDPAGFQSRLQELKAAQAAYDKSLADLNLGKGAKEAYDEAIAMRDEAARQREAESAKLQAEMKESYETLQKWSASTRDTANAKAAAAQQELADALTKHDQAKAELEQADRTLSEAQTKAHQLVEDAKAEAGRIVDSAKSDTKLMLSEAENLNHKAKIAQESAANHEQELTKKLSKLNAAIAASA